MFRKCYSYKYLFVACNFPDTLVSCIFVHCAGTVSYTHLIFHDRFIVLDYGTADERVFLCGASSKDAGARITSIVAVSYTHLGGRRECIMSIFCSLIREECNTFHSQGTVKTLESASQLPYRHTVSYTHLKLPISTLSELW